MQKTLSEIADGVIEKMTLEELKKAAKASIMLSIRVAQKVLEQARKDTTNGQEK